MFTGLVEEAGIVKTIIKNRDGYDLTILAKEVLNNLKIDDSIAVNGICLTVIEFSSNYFTVNAISETVSKTTLKNLRSGSLVNLERALQLSDRLGGHLVQGHIDGIGKLTKITPRGMGKEYQFTTAQSVLKYIVQKGSICLDGISLTIADISPSTFSVAIIPHTLSKTIIDKIWKIGADINIETDIIGRYLEKFILFNSNNKDKSSDSNLLEKLEKLGF